MTLDYYEIIGVTPDAEPSVIAAAYRAKMFLYHPDTYEGPQAEAERRSRKLNEAYDTLSDPVRRTIYDRSRSTSHASHQRSAQPPPPTSPSTPARPTANRENPNSPRDTKNIITKDDDLSIILVPMVLVGLITIPFIFMGFIENFDGSEIIASERSESLDTESEPSNDETSQELPPGFTYVADQDIVIRDPASCRFNSNIQRIFDNLLSYPEGRAQVSPFANFGAGSESIRIVPEYEALPSAYGRDTDTPTDVSTVSFPYPASWHGLRLSHLARVEFHPYQYDGFESNVVAFLESPERVSQVLSELGIEAPVSPEYRSITGGPCGGSMSVNPADFGSTLSCSWGC